MAWTPDRRAALLEENARLEAAPWNDRDATRRREAIADEYEAGLPRVPLSRCPFTRRAFELSIDTFGLDGLWWRYDVPVRPVEPRPASVFAVTGAIRLADKGKGVEPAPFFRKFGPEVPYVVPRILLHPDVKAVVSHLPIGRHDGYAIVYYADPVPPALARFNDWASFECRFEMATSTEAWQVTVEEDQLLDVDLVRWIRDGKVHWIAPGDTALTLRSDVESCPYLGMEGRTTFLSIEAPGPDEPDWIDEPRTRRRARTATAKRARK